MKKRIFHYVKQPPPNTYTNTYDVINSLLLIVTHDITLSDTDAQSSTNGLKLRSGQLAFEREHPFKRKPKSSVKNTSNKILSLIPKSINAYSNK